MSDEDRDQEDEEQPQEAAEEEQAPPQEPEDAEQAEGEPPVAPLGFFDFLRYTAVSFAAEAWIALGVQLRPGADELETDLRAARIAIDSLEFLVGQLADELEPEERQGFDAELTNLRVNYVRRSSAEEKEE